MLRKSVNREPYFDILKGILIFLVVFGHCLPEHWELHKWIYSFHMPAFFIADGFVLRYTKFCQSSFSKFLTKEVKGVLLPYLFFSVVLMLLRWWESSFSLEVIRFQMIDLITLCGIGAMWFLPCLFIARLFLRLILEKPYWGPLAIVLFFIPQFLDHQTFIGLVLFRSCIAIGFIYIGYLLLPAMKKFAQLNIGSIILLFFAFFAISIALCISSSQQYVLNSLQVRPALGYIAASLSGSFMVILLAQLFKLHVNWLGSIFAHLGYFSLFIMGLHQAIILIIPQTSWILLNIALNTLASIVLSILAAHLFQFIKFRRTPA